MWVVPTHIASLFLFYDPQVFSAHKWTVPQTLTDFLNYCKMANSAPEKNAPSPHDALSQRASASRRA